MRRLAVLFLSAWMMLAVGCSRDATDKETYSEGFRACKAGVPPEACPYSDRKPSSFDSNENGIKRRSWLRGWIDAKEGK